MTLYVKAWMREWVYNKEPVPHESLALMPPVSIELMLPKDIPLGHVLLNGERQRYVWLRDNFHILKRNPDGTCTHPVWPREPMPLADLIDRALARDRLMAGRARRKAERDALSALTG